jgi:phosphohistidine phosphatase SixA
MTTPKRRLILLRHAKSDWHAGADSDHERPLDARGRKDAPRVAERLSELGWVPQVVHSSDATRTRQTWDLVRPALSPRPEVVFTPDLYLATPARIRATIAALPPGMDTAMLIGHNPGWEDAVHQLTGIRVRMTTCNAALLSTDAGSWAEAAQRGDWVLERVVRPKEL